MEINFKLEQEAAVALVAKSKVAVDPAVWVILANSSPTLANTTLALGPNLDRSSTTFPESIDAPGISETTLHSDIEEMITSFNGPSFKCDMF
jgi:hypothetical protein